METMQFIQIIIICLLVLMILSKTDIFGRLFNPDNNQYQSRAQNIKITTQSEQQQLSYIHFLEQQLKQQQKQIQFDRLQFDALQQQYLLSQNNKTQSEPNSNVQNKFLYNSDSSSIQGGSYKNLQPIYDFIDNYQIKTGGKSQFPNVNSSKNQKKQGGDSSFQNPANQTQNTEQIDTKNDLQFLSQIYDNTQQISADYISELPSQSLTQQEIQSHKQYTQENRNLNNGILQPDVELDQNTRWGLSFITNKEQFAQFGSREQQGVDQGEYRGVSMRDMIKGSI